MDKFVFIDYSRIEDIKAKVRSGNISPIDACILKWEAIAELVKTDKEKAIRVVGLVCGLCYEHYKNWEIPACTDCPLYKELCNTHCGDTLDDIAWAMDNNDNTGIYNLLTILYKIRGAEKNHE